MFGPTNGKPNPKLDPSYGVAVAQAVTAAFYMDKNVALRGNVYTEANIHTFGGRSADTLGRML